MAKIHRGMRRYTWGATAAAKVKDLVPVKLNLRIAKDLLSDKTYSWFNE